jgi:hypothetical protein
VPFGALWANGVGGFVGMMRTPAKLSVKMLIITLALFPAYNLGAINFVKPVNKPAMMFCVKFEIDTHYA